MGSSGKTQIIEKMEGIRYSYARTVRPRLVQASRIADLGLVRLNVSSEKIYLVRF